MAQIAPLPGTGIDRNTGKIIAGWPHVVQSLRVIFTTFFGERVLRRWFGPKILGQNLTPSTVLKFWSAICVAIDTWEPRYKVTQIIPLSADRDGSIGFRINGVYRPRGHLGDFSVEQPRNLSIARIADNFDVREVA